MKDNEKKDNKALLIVGKILLIIIKILVVIFLLIPLYIGLIATLGATISYLCLVIKGFPYLSVLFGLLTLDLFIIFFTYILSKLVGNGNVKPMPLLLSFVGSLIFLVTASILFPFEVLRTDFIDEMPSNYEMNKTTYKINNKKIINLQNFDVNYVVDKKAKKSYRIEIKQYDDNNIMVDENESVIIRNYYDSVSFREFKKLVTTVYGNFEEMKVYNLKRIGDYEITIYANQKTINKIKQYNK